MNKILVTGAGGYIGRHVVRKLLDAGADVIASDIITEGIDSRARIYDTNVFSGSKNIFDELGKPDICLHMAWKDGFVHNSDSHMEYLSSHYRFIRDMLEGGLKHLVIMGTMHEIGYYEGEINENTSCNPTSLYGIAKDSLRRSVMLLVKDKNIVFQWLRAYYIYGDDVRNNSIFAKIIKADREGKKVFPFNTGRNKYDFIHVEELAEQIVAVTLQEKINGIINCCTGKPISLAEKVESFIREQKLDIELEYGAFPDRPYDSPAIWGNAEKIELIMENHKGES